MIEHNPLLQNIVRFALEEDLGSGDLTTDAIIDSEKKGKAFLISKENIVLAGLFIFKKVFLELNREIEFETYYDEGELIPAGKNICLIKGQLLSILKAERTALNLLQRMSGIASLTKKYVEKVEPFGVKILDTRKTAPGLRWIDKYAVRTGGGCNHRFGLFDGILIKDNHIAAGGSIRRAVDLARKGNPNNLKVEVEVETLAEAEEALQAGADILLLDNMTITQMKEVVRMINGRVMLEASGGITLDTIKDVAKTGVNTISIGALTHSAKAADLSLEISPDTSNAPG